MGTLGRNVLNYRSGYDDSIVAGEDVQWLMVGATIDWSLVSPAGSAVTLPSGRLIAAGQQYLRNGQVLCRIQGTAANAVSVATLNNSPAGGTFAVSVSNAGTTATTAPVAYNATGATVQTAVRLLANVNPATTVSGSAGGPYTFTFPAAMGSTQVSGDGSLMTGSGAQPTVTVAVTTDGRIGWFGPYDPSATNTGRDALLRGDCGIVERTIVYGGTLGLGERDDYHKPLIVGGHVWAGKVLQSESATHSLAAGPTRAELLAAMPRLVLVKKSYP